MANLPSIAFLVVLIALGSVSALEAKYSISKHYVEDKSGSTLIQLGKIVIFEEGEINQAYIEPEYPQFVTSSDLEKTQAVILTFTEIGSGEVFTTAVTSTKNRAHSEKIMILVSDRE